MLMRRRKRVREYDGEMVRGYGEKERKRKERYMCRERGGEREIAREKVEREKVKRKKAGRDRLRGRVKN